MFFTGKLLHLCKKKQVISEEFRSNGLKFYKAGNYREALSYFEEAYSKNVLSDEEKILLVSLFIQEDKIQRASSLVDELSNSPLSKTGDWFLLNGLIFFIQGDLLKAEKNFNSASKQEAHSALLNLSLLKWKTGDYKKSLSYLDQLVQTGYERDIVFYLRALNLLSQNRIGEVISHIGQELFSGRQSSLVEYRQELFLILAYSYMKEGRGEDLAKSVQLLLNEDPFFWKEYKYSSFITLKKLNWNILYPYCKSIFDSDSQNNLFNALYGFCYLRIGDLKQGSKYIEQAKIRESNNPLFLSLYAYLLMIQGRDFQLEQALSLIDYGLLEEKQTLPFILIARFFEEKGDWSRALSSWKNLLSLNVKHLSGMAGVALSSYKLGDLSTADVYKNRVLNSYPYHVQMLSYED